MDMLMIGIRKFVSYQNFADMYTLQVLIISGHLLELPMYLLFRQISLSNYISIPIQTHNNFAIFVLIVLPINKLFLYLMYLFRSNLLSFNWTIKIYQHENSKI